jgi:DHA2 family multidrug resistance protein
MVICLASFVVSQLTREKTLVDLSIFKTRNFTVGCILIFMFGAAIYGAVTILPLFFQEMLDYSAWWAGLAVSPRGLGSIVAMPIVGLLVAKLDTRAMVSTGFLIFGTCSLFWSMLTLQISPWSLTWPVVISGFSLGLVFVPLSTVTLGALPAEKVGNGSGLYNLMRNIGGSVGISVVETILTRHQQTHRSELVRNLSPTLTNLQNSLSHYTSVYTPKSGPLVASQQAIAQVGQVLDRQAQYWSYVDDFRYMALACFLCVPLVWMLKRVRARGAVQGAH